MRISDADSYIKSCRTLEKSENKKILDFISKWLEILKDDIHNKILSYYSYPENMNISDIQNISNGLNSQYEAFDEIFYNMRYVPIQPPQFTLKTMVDEIYSLIPEQMNITNIYFKNINIFNFTESQMKEPSYNINSFEKVKKEIGQTPNVLSMTVIYNNNPLMWPLIFHEYGHTVFAKIKESIPYSKIYDEITVHCHSNDIEIKPTKLTTIISEVFSDLFAINFYASNYFFAFYFHEILGSTTKKLMNLDENGNFDIMSHPPSAIRLKYMQKELDNKGYSKDNEALNTLLDYHRSYAEKLSINVDTKIEPKYIELYELIFKELSILFKDIKLKINYDLINILHNNLEKKLPIGTSCLQNIGLKDLLKLNKKEFDIDNYNQTFDMISSGWKFLIIDIIAKLYEESNYEKYLTYSEIDRDKIKDKAFDNKMLKLNKEYDFLTKNISYSIETSMIVSNYTKD